MTIPNNTAGPPPPENVPSPPETGPFYYVAIDPDTGIVQGWYQIFSRATAPNFREITLADYERLSMMPGAKIDATGNLVEYTPPTVVIPLKNQAESALQRARTHIYNNYGILGEPTPAAWVTYLRSLMAISSGTDTTSTALPAAPSDT